MELSLDNWSKMREKKKLCTENGMKNCVSVFLYHFIRIKQYIYRFNWFVAVVHKISNDMTNLQKEKLKDYQKLFYSSPAFYGLTKFYSTIWLLGKSNLMTRPFNVWNIYLHDITVQIPSKNFNTQRTLSTSTSKCSIVFRPFEETTKQTTLN
jgi:hypothetical protein